MKGAGVQKCKKGKNKKTIAPDAVVGSGKNLKRKTIN